MKQRITRKEIEILTEEQKRRLNELWIPALYDVAVARVLKNVAEDEYDEYEYVIGGISIHGTSISLTDIAAAKNGLSTQLDASETPEAIESVAKIDPVFGESYLGFGNRETFLRTTEGIGQAFGDKNTEDGSEEEEEDSEDFQEDEFSEEDLEDNYERPTTHIKEECTPLLSIGNMIEILQSNSFGKFEFYLTANTYEIGCELGKDNSTWGSSKDWEPAELCDVLWESVKELL